MAVEADLLAGLAADGAMILGLGNVKKILTDDKVMESEIITSLPTGNPILAYGTSEGKNSHLVIKIAALVLSILFSAAVVWFVFFFSFPYPSQTALLLTTKNNAALTGVSNIWGRAAQKNIRPLVLGLSWTDSGLVPYVITLRKSVLDANYKYDVGPVNILSDQPLALGDKRQVKNLLGLVFKLLGDDQGYLSLNGSVFFGPEWPVISGSINNNLWKTDVDMTVPEQNLPSGDVAINTKILPQAWPAMRSALETSGLVNLPDNVPDAVAWRLNGSTISSLELRYDESVPLQALQQMKAAAGSYSIKTTSLPDGILTQELELPRDSMSTGTQSTTSTSDYQLLTTTNTLILSFDEQNGDQTISTDPCLLENKIANIQGQALETILNRLNIPTSFQITKLEAASQDGKLIFCVK